MSIRKTLLLACIILMLASAVTNAAEPDNDSYVLFNVISGGYITVRDLQFTNRETGVEYRFRDEENIGRSARRFFLERVPAGEYYLSALYTTILGLDGNPRIDIDETGDYIVVQADTINYIGDLTITAEESAGDVVSITGISYEANGATLMAAVNSEKRLFRSNDVAVSIGGAGPVPVGKSLLGL